MRKCARSQNHLDFRPLYIMNCSQRYPSSNKILLRKLIALVSNHLFHSPISPNLLNQSPPIIECMQHTHTVNQIQKKEQRKVREEEEERSLCYSSPYLNHSLHNQQQQVQVISETQSIQKTRKDEQSWE